MPRPEQKTSTRPTSDQQAASVLNQILEQVQALSGMTAELGRRLSQVEQAQLRQENVQAQPQVQVPVTNQPLDPAGRDLRAQKLAAEAEVRDAKEDFWQRIQTQPKRRVNVSEDWEYEMFGVPIVLKKGLRSVPEEVAQAYEEYVLRMQAVEGFENRFHALAAGNSRTPGMVDYDDLGKMRLRG